MSFHHVAVATNDIEATHAFYTDVMGFDLVKAVVAPTENPGGWAKHLFYETGQGMIAFWDIHDDGIGDFDPAISTGLGLPTFVNHIAFTSSSLDDLAERTAGLQGHGFDVVEVDHGFCNSIYVTDPNGIMVEWCCDTTPLTDADRDAAHRLLANPNPPMDEPPAIKIHEKTATPALDPQPIAGA